jgi:hypothetical protein
MIVGIEFMLLGMNRITINSLVGEPITKSQLTRFHVTLARAMEMTGMKTKGLTLLKSQSSKF